MFNFNDAFNKSYTIFRWYIVLSQWLCHKIVFKSYYRYKACNIKLLIIVKCTYCINFFFFDKNY